MRDMVGYYYMYVEIYDPKMCFAMLSSTKIAEVGRIKKAAVFLSHVNRPQTLYRPG